MLTLQLRYIDWHSYGQYILLPYGYDCAKRASNHETQMSLALSYRTTVAQQYSKTFTYGPACDTIYPTTGDSTDYLTDVSGADLAWCIELRGGGVGFILPADQILPSGIEQWEALKQLVANM